MFFFSALGTFNGVLLSLILFNKRNRTPAYFFLGLCLLMLSIRIGKSVLLYFDNSLPKLILQIGLSACFLIGPSLFFYIRYSFTRDNLNKKDWKFTFAILLFLILAIGIPFGYTKYVDLWNQVIVKVIYAEWLFFIMLSVIIYWRFTQQGKKTTDKMVVPVLISNILVFIAYIFSWTNWVPGSYISGSILFSFLLYLNFYIIFRKPEGKDSREQEKYPNKKISDEHASQLFSKLEKIVTEEELYKNPNLKLIDLAVKLNVTSHQLSQLLNDNLEKSFSLFINEYRIEEACKLILSDSYLKVEEIGYEVGFNSKSTFFSTFRKIKNTTPFLYKQSQTV